MSYDLLFVDDDPLFLSRCQDIFAGSPYTLHFAQSGEQALSLLQDGLAPVVLIVEQSMAGMDGPTLLKEVDEHHSIPSYIMMARECDSILVAKAINNSGLFRYFVKGVTDDELQQGVLAAISHYGQRKQSLQAAKSIVGMNNELEDLTSHLEKIGAINSDELQKSNDENVQLTHTLQRTVRELEGRDRILRHLLTLHKLEDTLQTILEVLDDVLSMSWGGIYVKDDHDVLQQVCTFAKDKQDNRTTAPSRSMRNAVADGTMEMVCQSDENYGSVSVAVPIYKGDLVLGGIELVWHGGLSEDELIENAQSVYTFTVHAAIAISDHNVSSDKSNWSKTLDDVLLDFME